MTAIIIEGILSLLAMLAYVLSKSSEWLIFTGIILIIMMLERLITAVQDMTIEIEYEDDWIPVDAALPPEPERDGHYWPEYNVMVKGMSIPTTCEYRGAGVWIEPHDSIPYSVVCWQPLPDPPHEES